MGVQNIESLHLLNSSSRSGCSPTSSRNTSSGFKTYRQTLLTDKLIVRPNGKALSVKAGKAGNTPDMQKSDIQKDKRFKPYQRPTPLTESDQNHPCKLTGRVKLPSSLWTLKLERLPLRNISSESYTTSPTAQASSPSHPLQPRGNFTSAHLSRSEKFVEPSVKPCKTLKDSADEHSDLLLPSNGSPILPPQPEDFPSDIPGSSMNSHHKYRTEGSWKSFLLSPKDTKCVDVPVPVDRKDDAGVIKSPYRVSSLKLTKNSHSPQFTPKQTKEDREIVLIHSSSESSCDLSSSSNTSCSESVRIGNTSTKAKKKMRIHRKLDSSKEEVIVIDDPPKSRKRYRSSSSSDEFEDSRFLHKRRRKEVIDLTVIEDSPPKVVTSGTSSFSDPNRTPEFLRSPIGFKNKNISQCKLAVKKTLFTLQKSSDVAVTPMLEKSFGIAPASEGRVDEFKEKEIGQRSSDGSDAGCDENAIRFDENISEVMETCQETVQQDERLYEAMSESSFHSCASMDPELDEQVTVKGNVELVQGFTLDLNSEDDDDVFVKDANIMPSSLEPVSSPSVSPEPEEKLTEKVNSVQALSLVGTGIGEPVDESAELIKVQSSTETSARYSQSRDVNFDYNGVPDESEEVPRKDDAIATQPGPHIDCGSIRHPDIVGVTTPESTGHVLSAYAVESVVSTMVPEQTEQRKSHTTEMDSEGLHRKTSVTIASYNQHEIWSLVAARGITTNWVSGLLLLLFVVIGERARHLQG